MVNFVFMDTLENLMGSPRRKRGVLKKISSPDQLLGMAIDYMQEVDDSPFIIKDFIKGGPRAGEVIEMKKQRPYTWMGFNTFVFNAVGLVRLEDYKTNREGRYSEFVDVVRTIDGFFKTQKFEGAAVGAFNHNIIAYDLGMVKKVENTVKTEQPLFGKSKE